MSDAFLHTTKGRWKVMGEQAPATSDLWDELMASARETQKNAYSPYSKFRVGAAALVDGKIFVGCNVENSSYGATMCAERVALFSAIAAGARNLEIMALTTDAREDPSIESRSPCGLCRQVMSEFSGPETIILLDAGSSDEASFLGEVLLFNDIMPWQFRLG